ncbi:hypothetical protein [Micromonospora sp. RL09-050-HVF-A]|uniref:hypothetical protein n=1 Tax=Micromonospora sp. RL09-050-HVF-A TaxID=1703433 RepID=UPI001C5D6307|nr:hypothetical protein [Micromonospora sp. RL09-050-HVF-A]MBW4702289.1 hypothetical protein [Micromonospora sp. RL09-050-HVF-A]
MAELGGRDGGDLDGFHVGWVPDGAGELVSDFASEWEDVSFASRVWERAVEDGYRVDLRVHVLRGERLTTLLQVRDFLAGYHERDSAEWPLAEFGRGDGVGLTGGGEAFWLVRPGLAVDVLVDVDRFDAEASIEVASSIRELPHG